MNRLEHGTFSDGAFRRAARGGRGEIRTHGTLAGTPVFKTGALNHSATLPVAEDQPFAAAKIKDRIAHAGRNLLLGDASLS